MAGERSRDESVAEDSVEAGGQLLDLQRLFALSQDLMCVTDAQARFLRVSASSARVLGYQPQELRGRKFLDLVHPNDLQATLLAHEAVLRGAQVVEFENRYVRKDGSLVELRWTSSWVAGADDSGATYSLARDITNRKRAERLRESQREVLQLIVGGSPLSDVLRRICKYASAVPGSLLLEADEYRAGARSPQVVRIERSTVTQGMVPGTQWQGCGGMRVSLSAASGRHIGVLCVADKQTGDFAPNDERVLTQLADLAAVGLGNARLYTELEERVSKRTVELRESNERTGGLQLFRLA